MTDSLQREFIKISQAVGVGFLIMGVIGYVVKLIHSTPCLIAMPLPSFR
jgi:preprotein translocase subunit Sss1